MSIDTGDSLAFDLTGTPGATNQSVPTRSTNDRFGEILPIVGTAVMGALRPKLFTMAVWPLWDYATDNKETFVPGDHQRQPSTLRRPQGGQADRSDGRAARGGQPAPRNSTRPSRSPSRTSSVQRSRIAGWTCPSAGSGRAGRESGARTGCPVGSKMRRSHR